MRWLLLIILLPLTSLAASVQLKTGTTRMNITPTNITSGLVLWLSFDGRDMNWTSATAATCLDRSGNGNTAVISSSSRNGVLAGKHGQAMPSGTVNAGHGASLADIALQGGGGMTVAWWYKRNANNSTQVIMAKGLFSAGYWALERGTATEFFSKDLTNASLPNMEVAFPDIFSQSNEWHHYVFTWNGSTNKQSVQMFMDGYQIFGAANIIVGTAPPISDAANDMFFLSGSGNQDEIMIWSRVLSNTEIYQLATDNCVLIGNTGIKPSTNIIDADLFLEGESASWTNGGSVTTSMLAEGAHDNIGGTWSVFSPQLMYVTNVSLPVYSPVRVNGVIYTNLGGTHGIAFGYTNAQSRVRYTLGAKTNIVMSCWMTIVDNADSSVGVDRLFMDGNTNNGLAVLTCQTANPNMIAAHGQDGVGFVFGNWIPYVPNKLYWATLGYFATNSTAGKGTSIVELYDPMQYSERTGTLLLVGHSEVRVNQDSQVNLNFGYYNDPATNTNQFAVYGDWIIGYGVNAKIPFGP